MAKSVFLSFFTRCHITTLSNKNKKYSSWLVISFLSHFVHFKHVFSVHQPHFRMPRKDQIIFTYWNFILIHLTWFSATRSTLTFDPCGLSLQKGRNSKCTLDWIGKLVPYGVILIAIALLNEGNMRFRLASSSIPNTWISPVAT